MLKEERIAEKLEKLLPSGSKFTLHDRTINFTTNKGLEVEIMVTDGHIALLRRMFALVDERRSISSSLDLFEKIEQEVDYEFESGRV